jgi:hypothetical protein
MAHEKNNNGGSYQRDIGHCHADILGILVQSPDSFLKALVTI